MSKALQDKFSAILRRGVRQPPLHGFDASAGEGRPWPQGKEAAVKLGILLNTARHLEDVVGITRAALPKNHQVNIFAMDEGTKLLENQILVSLFENKPVWLAERSRNAVAILHRPHLPSKRPCARTRT